MTNMTNQFTNHYSLLLIASHCSILLIDNLIFCQAQVRPIPGIHTDTNTDTRYRYIGIGIGMSKHIGIGMNM